MLTSPESTGWRVRAWALLAFFAFLLSQVDLRATFLGHGGGTRIAETLYEPERCIDALKK